MVTASLQSPFLVVTIALAGCFDVSGAQRTPLLVDDFDRGDLLPIDPHFDQWRCGRFEPNTNQNCDCEYDDKIYHSSPYSMHLYAEVRDTPDGKQDFSGAQLYTQATVPEDLSHMSRIGFNLMLDCSESPGAVLYIEIHCSLVRAPGTAPASKHYVQHAVDCADAKEWQPSFAIPLTQDCFSVPTNWRGAGIEGGLTACLERVDGIHFSVNAQLLDGKAGIVNLHLDDLYFE